MLQNRHRIIAIEGVKSCGSLLIAMFRDEEGEDYVELSAWHSVQGKEPLFQINKLYFDNDRLSEKFIKHYSPECAQVLVSDFYEKFINQPGPVSEGGNVTKGRITIYSNVTTNI